MKTQSKQTWHIRYLVNRREPEADTIADEMREAGIVFATLPTSGPLTLTVEGIASYGLVGVRFTADRLIEIAKSGKWPK